MSLNKLVSVYYTYYFSLTKRKGHSGQGNCKKIIRYGGDFYIRLLLPITPGVIVLTSGQYELLRIRYKEV